jgi:predicted nucleotidyltransferase
VIDFPPIPVPATLSAAARSIVAWAASEPLVDGVYLFGSRVRGSARDDSDLDVAVAVAHPDDDMPYKRFEIHEDCWREALCMLTGFDVHLTLASAEDHPQTWGYLMEGCARVYARGGVR